MKMEAGPLLKGLLHCGMEMNQGWQNEFVLQSVLVCEHFLSLQ